MNFSLNSTTNRIVLVCLIAYFLVDGLFRQQFSGFELFALAHPDFQWWQLLSSMFLHGSISHLLLNMFALWSFGQVLERVWGGQRFLVFYLACGVGAGLISLWVNQFQYDHLYQLLLSLGASANELTQLLDTGRASNALVNLAGETQLRELYALYHSPMVGASGAIYGILAAFAILFPNFKVALIFLPIPIAAKFFVPVLLGIDLLASFTGFSIFGLNIAHYAHLGGAAVGAILVFTWRKSETPH